MGKKCGKQARKAPRVFLRTLGRSVAPYGVFVLSSGELKKNEPRKTNRTQKSFG